MRLLQLKVGSRLGMLLLAIWLILQGVGQLANITFQGESAILALIALAAGILILIGR